MNVAQRLEVERKIITKLMKTAIKAGHTVSIWDGEEWAVKRSTDIAVLKQEIMATDMETIRIRKTDGTMFGDVFAVYGNDGYDVMADSTCTDEFNAFLKPVEDYAETFQ